MKKMVKVILAAAAVVALAVPAMAADKLIVKDAAGTTDVFKVTDVGSISTSTGGFAYDGTTKLAGFGTSAPVAALSVTAQTSSPTRGFVNSQHTNNAAGVVAVARKSRGTEAVPVKVNTGDYIMSFGFYPYDGASWLQTGWFGAYIDGAVSTGITPTSIYFATSDTATLNPFTDGKVRLLIKPDGKVGIGTTTPTSQLSVVGLPTYDTVAAATGAGLTTGAIFKTTGNVLMIVP